jgi:hypothetical protein
LEFRYRPKQTLRCNRYESILNEVPEVRRHLQHVAEVLESGRAYVETGWPVFSWVPYFHDKYGDRLKLVHLMRHPVYFACSLATHEYYQPDLKNGGFNRYAELSPADKGIIHKGYAAVWKGLSAHEMCLFSMAGNPYLCRLSYRKLIPQFRSCGCEWKIYSIRIRKHLRT